MEAELIMWGLLIMAIISAIAAAMGYGYNRGFKDGQVSKVGDLVEAYLNRKTTQGAAVPEGSAEAVTSEQH